MRGGDKDMSLEEVIFLILLVVFAVIVFGGLTLLVEYTIDLWRKK